MAGYKCGEYRPCIVDGTEKALFHRWVEIDRLILNFDLRLRKDQRDLLMKEFNRTGVVPEFCTTEKAKGLFGLVELEDGTVKAVEPLRIKFLDSGNQFYKNDMFFRYEKEKQNEV